MLPAIEVQGFDFYLDPSKVDIKLSGSITADIENLFIDVFSNIALQLILVEVDRIFPGVMEDIVN